MCNCKAVTFAKNEGMVPGEHVIGKIDFICPMCRNDDKLWFLHGPSDDYAGYSYECGSCRSYIQYLLDDSFYKEEFYFDDEKLYLILENECIIFDSNNKILLIIPPPNFTNREHLLSKVKTYILFS